MVLRISWSGLRTHEECKQRGYLTRTGKKATLENQRNFLPGNVTDRVVRYWLEDNPTENIGKMPLMVAETLEKQYQQTRDEGGIIKFRDREDKANIIKDCTEAVTKIEPLLLKFVVPFEYQADFKFEAPMGVRHPNGGIENVLLIGYMDILVHDPERDMWFVFDVKHTRDNSYWRKTIAQLGFYDLAVELIFGKPTSLNALMQPLCTQKMPPYKPSPESRAQLQQRISGMARDIWLNDHSPRTDTKECGWCPVKHACPKFTPVVQADGSRRITLKRA